MSHSQNATTLDLHGRRLEEAISEVTSFLDRIRRTVAASSMAMGRSGGHHVLFVQIITGSGSHSSHGPILRSAVQKLLEKRGMTFRLERGGGLFQVDALSGCDLYDSALATDSKVVVAEQDDFQQLALLRRRNTVGNIGHASIASNSGPPRTVSVPLSSFPHSNSDPLPSQVASEDAVLRSATELSVGDSQQQRNRKKRMSMEFERQFDRAVSESHLEQMAVPRRREAKEEEEELQLKLAYEKSVIDEQHHQQLTEKQYENTIMLAMEESANEANRQKASEDDLVQQALAESMALAEAENSNNSEDDLLERALAESLMEEERRKSYYGATSHGVDILEEVKTNSSEDDLLEMALAESLMEEEKQATSHGVDILEEVKKLSLKQEEEETIREEEALKKIIEMSKHMR